MNYQEKWQAAKSYDAYRSYTADRLEEGKSTGDNDSEYFLEITKMNLQRMKRIEKTFKANDEVLAFLRANNHLKVLVITEGWCGDAAQSTPIIHKYAEQAGMESRFILRDEHLDLIDAHLTNGGRSIPIVLFIDEDWKVKHTWGPRPAPLQDIVMDYKKKEDPKPAYTEFAKEVQLWYAKDKQQTLDKELSEFFA